MNRKIIKQKVGTIILIVILICSGLLIIMPSGSNISTANNAPTSTEKIDNDFYNGTLNNTEIDGKGNDTVLILNSSIFNTSVWTKKKLKIQPCERAGHAMATIWGTDKVLLYGGMNMTSGFKNFNDTWIYDYSENNWTNMNPLGNPGKTFYHALASIYGTDKVLLFSAYLNPNNYTWIYDLSNNSWTEKARIPSKLAMNKAAMAPVFGTDKVVLFGEINEYNQTWIFDLSNNTWTNRTPKDPKKTPIARSNHAMTSIYGTQKILLNGGSLWNGSIWVRYNDTWIYDLVNDTWTRMFTPTYPDTREHHAMVTLYGTDKVLLYGGLNYVGSVVPTWLNDTWIYDYSNNIWTNIEPGIDPGRRFCHAMAFVYGTTSAVLFGGNKYKAIISNDTWTYSCIFFQENGTYISSPYNIGPNSSLKTINWNAWISNNTFIEFQFRSAKSELGLSSKLFVGIDGAPSSYYTNPGSNIWSGHEGDSWIQYKAYFKTINVIETPVLKNVTIIYNHWPNTTLISPNNSSILAYNNPGFVWNFTDSDSTNQTDFQVLIDNDIEFKSIDFDSSEQSSINYSWQFPNGTSYSKLPDGTWYWKVRTKDNDGDWGLYSLPWKIIIDTVAPNSTIIYPKNNRYYNSLDIVSGKANDPIYGDGIDKVEIQIKNVNNDRFWNGYDWTAEGIWLLTNGTKEWSYNSSSVIWTSGSQYHVRSRAIDNATNVEIPRIGKVFTIDLDEPVFSDAWPLITDVSTTEDVKVGITISDAISGVNASTIQYAVSENNGKTWSPWVHVTDLNNDLIINITLNLSFPNGTANRIKWRAADIAGNGPVESKPYIIKINTWQPSLNLRVNLWRPKNNSVLQTTSVELSWMLENSNLMNVTYDVYFDTVNPPATIYQSRIINTSLIVDDLINGQTYYWTVLPRIGTKNGSCLSGVWSFKIEFPVPSVKLKSPENGSIVYSPKPTLAWSLEYEGTNVVTFDVYLDTNTDLEIFYETCSTPYLLPTINLEAGKKYYWQVVPNASGIQGPPSEVWSFTVEKKDHLPNFELRLKVEPAVIELAPDETKFVKAIVTNLGGLTDTISLRIWVPPGLGVSAVVNQPNITEVLSGGIAEFNITVTASENALPAEIVLSVVATSETAPEYGLDVTEETIFVVKIIAKDTEQSEKDKASASIGVWYFFFIVMIIVLIFIILAFLIIRKKRTEQKIPVVEVEPEVTLIPEIISEQVPTASTPVLPDTGAPATDPAQLAVSTTPGLMPVPILTKTTQSTLGSIPSEPTSTQAPQVQTPQLPLLPPAQLEPNRPEIAGITPSPKPTPTHTPTPKVTSATTPNDESTPTAHLQDSPPEGTTGTPAVASQPTPVTTTNPSQQMVQQPQRPQLQRQPKSIVKEQPEDEQIT